MKRFLRWLLTQLYELFIGGLTGLLRLIAEITEQRRHRRRLRDEGHRYVRCQVIPPSIYKRPDPLIYSQSYLMAQGLAVTWDNPDIQLFAVGSPPVETLTPVSSSDLRPDTTYEIQATIYNGSTDAPAIGMAVQFSYLSFGIGTTSHPIGATTVNLGVKAGANHPALARIRWRTPAAPGHYCIQVNLVWADDANPKNNLGQENVNVGIAHSPATFQFAVQNRNLATEAVMLIADAYTIPALADCEELLRRQDQRGRRTKFNGNEDGQKDARRAWCAAIARRHEAGGFPLPVGWRVDITPQRFELAPDHRQQVTVTITPPDTFHGSQAVNVNGFNARRELLGGVTLVTQR